VAFAVFPQEDAMGLFATIMSKIFPSNHPAVAAAQGNQPPVAAQQSAQQTPGTASGSTSAAMAPVDVEQVLNGMAAKNPQKLNWRTSIVDLMKLTGIDSSFDARKKLAQELHYTGDMNDSAAMNIWLHKQVMSKLAENGGQVPQELLH
jgi:hypothetical protein